MKKIALLLALAALGTACNKLAPNEYEINGVTDPTWEGRTVALQKQTMFGIKVVDTTKIKNAAFTFHDTVSEPGVYMLKVDDRPGEEATLIVEPGSIDILMRKDTIGKSRAKGTFNNDKYSDFIDFFTKEWRKIQIYEHDNNDALNKAKKTNDTVTVNKLIGTRQKMIKEVGKQAITFVKENPKAYVSLLAIPQLQRFEMADNKTLSALYDGLDAAIKKTTDGRHVGMMLKTADQEKAAVPEHHVGVKVGDTAPLFSAKNPEGKEVSLKESLGTKVTIIDFWASWCPPCRKENPNMVALYKKYHAKGLNIIGVSLDKTADKWIEAIKKDGLTWPQLSNLKYWDEPIAKLYGVEQIPAPFILDASGKVIARDVYGADLEKLVEKLLQ